MKKTVLATLVAAVAFSAPALADDTARVLNNDNSSVAQDSAVAVTAGVAFNGGVVNSGKGYVTTSENSIEADRGGIANTAGGTVTKESGNASTEADRGGIVASGAVTKESGNTSVEADRGGIVSSGAVTKESGNADDGSVVAAGPVNTNKAEDGGIAATGDVRRVGIEDSFNKKEVEVEIGDVNVMVSLSDLNSEVENNEVETGTRSSITTGNISNRGSAFSGATGISVVKSNTGINSSMQTSVNVNANVSK